MTNSTENVAKNVANEKVQDYVKKSHITTENEPKSEKTAQDVQKNCSSLTEKWKKGELKGGLYYIRNKAHSIKFNQMAFYMVYGEVSYWTNCKDEEVEEILAPVPSYEEWQSLNELVDCMNDTGKAFAHMLSPFTDDYFNGLTTKDIAELAKKSIRLTTQHCEDNAEIDKLKKLLKECYEMLAQYHVENSEPSLGENIQLLTKIDEVLK